MNDQIFSPSDFSYVMNDLKDSNLEDVSVGQLLEDVQVYNHNEPNAYDTDQSDVKPAAKKRKTSKVCDSTVKPSTSNLEMLPCLTEFPGQFGFQLFLPSEVSAPHRWTFSRPLNKVFIDIDKVLALQFKWNYMELKQDVQLFVRALPVYTSPDWMKEPVLRCPLHILPDNATNIGFPYVEHIIRCEHSSTRYEKDDFSGRLSCVTPLSYPQPGSETTTLTYKFVCKTSCPSGMDRKPISILFTLEDLNAQVFGRQPLAVKICSCPKRDRAKEEQQNETEKKVTSRTSRSRATGGSLSVRSSKIANNENLKDIQSFNDEGSTSSDGGQKRHAKKIMIAQKRIIDSDLMDTLKEIKEEMRNINRSTSTRPVDAIQMFADSIGAQLRELPIHHLYEVQAEIQRMVSYRRSIMYGQQQMIVQSQCLTPAPSIPSPESVDYENHRSQQITPVVYRNWHLSHQ